MLKYVHRKDMITMTNIKNERYIPLKNYVLAVVIVIVVCLLAWYAFAWYNVLQESKVSTSYLIEEKVISNEINDLNAVESTFLEVPDTYFVYVSYTGSESIYNMEKDLKDVIKEYNLSDIFYYLNVTSIKDEDNYIDLINESLNLEDRKITSVPTILYYKDGKLVDMISRDDNIMNVGDFQKLLDVNNVSKE